MSNFTKIMIPFKTEKNYFQNGLSISLSYKRKTAAGVVVKAKQKWIEQNLDGDYLLDSVAKKLTNADENERICRSYVLNREIKTKIGFPSHLEAEFIARGENEGVKIRFGDVRLHFFETNVAFCEIEFCVLSDDPADYVKSNYFMSELKSKNNVFTSIEQTKDGALEKKNCMRSLVEGIFDGIDGVASFENDEKMSFTDKKPLVFGYFQAKDRETAEKYLKIAMYNYKESYKVSEQNNLCSFFDNCLYGASDLGVITAAYLTGDKDTDHFFSESYAANLKRQYFNLYLLLLNEKYTLIKRLSQYGALAVKKNIFGRPACETAIRELNVMLNKSILMKARCDMTVVSFVPQIQKYFEYVKKQFKIDFLLEEEQKRNAELTQMMTVYKEYLDAIEQKEKKAIERKKRLNQAYVAIAVFLITNILGTINIFAKALEIAEYFTADVTAFPAFLFPLFLTAIFTIGITVQIIAKIKEAVEIKKEEE